MSNATVTYTKFSNEILLTSSMLKFKQLKVICVKFNVLLMATTSHYLRLVTQIISALHKQNSKFYMRSKFYTYKREPKTLSFGLAHAKQVHYVCVFVQNIFVNTKGHTIGHIISTKNRCIMCTLYICEFVYVKRVFRQNINASNGNS